MVGSQQCSNSDMQKNSASINSEEVLSELIQISKELCNNSNYNQNSEENMINDFFSSTLRLKGKFTTCDQTRQGISSTGKSAGLIDIKLYKGENEVAIIEALRLSSITEATIKKHVDKVVKNYNPHGTPAYLLIYSNATDFPKLWNDFVKHMLSYKFPHVKKRDIQERDQPSAAIRVADCILSNNEYDFPLTFIAVNLFQ